MGYWGGGGGGGGGNNQALSITFLPRITRAGAAVRPPRTAEKKGGKKVAKIC